MAERAITIYVVDDDKGFRESMALLLTTRSFDARTFESASEFLSAAAPSYDSCILLDLNMPGVGGFEVLRIIVERNILAPVIVVSGSFSETERARALRDGAFAVLQKPIRADALIETIHNALSG